MFHLAELVIIYGGDAYVNKEIERVKEESQDLCSTARKILAMS